MSISTGITEAIARQEWLTPTEETLQGAIHQIFARAGKTGAAIADVLHGTWIGHPLHVILTDIPLGAWTSAMLFDAVASLSENDGMDTAADACVATGIAGALASAVTGLTDWQDVDPPARRVGLIHGALNIVATSLFAASLVQRRSGARSSGRALGLLGFVVGVAAAQLGGKLVYEHRIGVDRAAEKPLPADFQRTIAADELEENKPTRVEVNGTPVLLVRSQGEIYALAETCSHLSGPLSEGKLEGGTIQCPWHGSRFRLEDGRVVNGPAVHPQPCLETRIVNGSIEVRRRNS